MKLSKLDIRIIMALKAEDAPMANYQLAKKLEKYPSQTFRRLTLMGQNRVLKVIAGYPKFYALEPSNSVQSYIVMVVECPHCKKLHIRHQNQTTVQCECLTLSGKKRRFYVFNGRIKSKKVLTPQSEEDKTDDVKAMAAQEAEAVRQHKSEIEEDVADILKNTP